MRLSRIVRPNYAGYRRTAISETTWMKRSRVKWYGLYYEALQRKILAESELTSTKETTLHKPPKLRETRRMLYGNTTSRPPKKQVETEFSVQRDIPGGAYKAKQLDSRRGHHPLHANSSLRSVILQYTKTHQ